MMMVNRRFVMVFGFGLKLESTSIVQVLTTIDQSVQTCLIARPVASAVLFRDWNKGYPRLQPINES